MSDDEGDGAVADTRIDWIIARVGDTRPTMFKMAEVGKMKIDENSQCEPPPHHATTTARGWSQQKR